MTDRSREQPFRLGRWRVEPRELRLVSREETRTLEPRVMAVLLALARTPGQVVTKDELVADAWQGAPVTDNAITWAISRLRKGLAPDGELIATVTGRGYRLEGEITPLDGARTARRHGPWIVALVAAIAAAGIVLLWPREAISPGPAITVEPRRLTTLPGRETEPAVSTDGRWLAFSHRATPADHWQLRIVETAEERLFPVTDTRGEATEELRSSGRAAVPRRIPQPQSNNRAPSWSPSGRQLAYFAHTATICTLRVMQLDQTLSVLEDRLLTRCEVGSSGRVAWADETTLLASLSTAGRYRLHRVDLASRDLEAVSDPGDALPGDRVFGIAPGSDRVALIRHGAGPQSELLLGTPDGSAWERLGGTPFWFHAVAIDDRGRLRFNATDRELVSYDPATGALDPLLRHPHRVWGLSRAGESLVFESFPVTRARIVARDAASGAERTIVTSSATERSPAVAPDGTLAWVSDRTGTAQLWLREPDGEDRQFSDARDGQRFGALRWSPDGSRLLALADGVIGSLGRSVADFAVHSLPGDVVVDPSWSPDGREVRFSLRTGDRWDWYAVGAGQLPETRRQVLDDVRAGRLLPSGRVAHFRSSEPGLWVLETDGTRRLVAEVAPPAHWWATNEAAWIVAAGQLTRVDLGDGSTELVLGLDPTHGTAIARAPGTGAWLLTRFDNPESDIVAVPLPD